VLGRTPGGEPNPHDAAIAVDHSSVKRQTGPMDVVGPHHALRQRFEATASQLRGRGLIDIRYWDVQNLSGAERKWDYGDWHHAVMGVDLMTDRGPACVMWTNTFFPYGVEVFLSPAAEHLTLGEGGPESWPASDSTRWRPLLGRPIRQVSTHWERLSLGPATLSSGEIVSPAREVELPVAIRLDLDSTPVWLIAAIPQWPEMREVFIPGDEIMIVFTSKRMREIGFPDTSFTAN